MSNQYITQSDTNKHKNDIYSSHKIKPPKEIFVFWSQKFVNVINFDVLVPRLATKNISKPNDSKLLSIKIESKQFKSNFNPHFITTMGFWCCGFRGERNDVDHIF